MLIKEIKMNAKSLSKQLAIILISILMICGLGADVSSAATAMTATGLVNSSSGAYLRSSSSTDSKSVKLLNDNTKLTITSEVFKSTTSTKKTNKWFEVTVSGKKGYIRSDLVDNIKYSQIKCKTTDALNYRVGPGTSMKKQGTLKKGAVVYKVLKAQAKGSSSTWYKIKVDGKYYYVLGKYLKEVTDTPDTTISLSGETIPNVVARGSSFILKGIISCNKDIQKVKIGITDSNGKWKTSVSRTVGANTFDISTVDSEIKFGSLANGSYIYRCDVTVGGKTYTKIKESFKVAKLEGAKLLAQTALNLAWPLGTDSSVYSYPSGSPMPEYATALDVAFGSRSSWGEQTRAGVSCDIFVATVCRYSGYDTTMERSGSKMWKCFEDTTKWQEISYDTEADLQSGDIIIYDDSGSTHTFIYVVSEGQGCVAMAAYNYKQYPFLKLASKSSMMKKDGRSRYAVYRAVK